MSTDPFPVSNPSADPAGSAASAVEDRSDDLSHDTAPTSFGVFKPVGQVMIGLPSAAQVDSLTIALAQAGWAPEAMKGFAPRETAAEIEAMIEQAGPLAGLGYEIKMLQRYLEQTRLGTRWLLVAVDSTDHAAELAAIARQHEAVMAVHYRLLTVEDLL